MTKSRPPRADTVPSSRSDGLRPTVGDVARGAQVSKSTASRVLSGRGYVSSEALERVRRAVDTLGYVPNDIARSLKARSSRVIGMVIDDLSEPFFAEVAAGIESVLRAHGFRMFLAATEGVSQNEAEALERFAAMQAEGIIISASTPDSPAIMRDAIARRIPIVEVDRRVADGACDGVVLENERAGYLATRHLIELGHRHIVVVGGPFTSGDGRIAGYRSALAEAGIPVDERLISRVSFHPADPASAVGQVLDASPHATALFTTGDILAEGGLMALRRRRRTIPGDFSIVGFDDVPWMLLIDPSLTTVAQPTREIGTHAAELLLDRVEGRVVGPPLTRYLEPRLVVRESTGPAPRSTVSLS